MASPPTHTSDDSLPKKASKFTVFVRLPFPRRDFVDPPPVSQSASIRPNGKYLKVSEWTGPLGFYQGFSALGYHIQSLERQRCRL